MASRQLDQILDDERGGDTEQGTDEQLHSVRECTLSVLAQL